MEKVRTSNGKYALSVPTIKARFYLGREPCDLMTVGRHAVGLKTTGLVVLKGSPLLKRLNKAIAATERSGIAEKLLSEWYDGPCTPGATSGAGPATAVMFDTIVVAYLLSLAAFY